MRWPTLMRTVLGCVSVLLVVTVAVARASGTPAGTPVPVKATTVLSSAIEREAARIVQADDRLVSGFQRSGQMRSGPHVPRCVSKKKGLLVGAMIGGPVGAAFAAYWDRRIVGRIRSTVVAEFAAAGAGIGALVGVAYCSG